MGWKGFIRELERNARAQERASLRRRRELLAAAKHQQKVAAITEAAMLAAENERKVALFENYLEVIVSVHHDSLPRRDWQTFATASPPPEPVRSRDFETAARTALDTYQPGFFAKLFGSDKKVRAQLTAAISEAMEQDTAVYHQRVIEQGRLASQWRTDKLLAERILAGDKRAYFEFLSQEDLFAEATELGQRLLVREAGPDLVIVECQIHDTNIVPTEELKLGARSKLIEKDMAESRRLALYQDHVCSTALRAARDVFALVPTRRVIANVYDFRVDSANGNSKLTPILAVNFEPRSFQKLNFLALDPSDSMKNFNHRMAHKKTAGFSPVEPYTADDSFAESL